MSCRGSDYSTASLIRCRVMRGPSWKWFNQDRGEGNVGTVVDEFDGVRLEVNWIADHKVPKAPRSKKYEYRTGEDDAYDLRLVANKDEIHTDIHCDACGIAEICGIRWKCAQCYDYDLCTACYMCDEHSLCHQFVRFPLADSNATGIKLSPRSFTPKYPLMNLRDEDWPTLRQDFDSYTAQVYRDHLPVIGLIQPSSIQGLQFCPFVVGERVVIEVDEDILCILQEGHGGFTHHMIKSCNRLGTVLSATQNGDSIVHFDNARTLYTINSEALVKVGPFSEGDYVMVSTDLPYMKQCQETHLWDDAMINALGSIGRVQSINNNGTVLVDILNYMWTFSPRCLTVCKNKPQNALSFATATPSSPDNVAGAAADGAASPSGDTSSSSETVIHNPAAIRAMEKHLKELEHKYTCAICMERERDAVFACGHTACVQCAAMINPCHICRKPVNGYTKMYFT